MSFSQSLSVNTSIGFPERNSGKLFVTVLLLFCANRFSLLASFTKPRETCAWLWEDCCSSLLFLSKHWGCCSQSLTGTEGTELIPPVLTAVPLPPVHITIDFEILLLVYKTLNGIVPGYMLDIAYKNHPDLSGHLGPFILMCQYSQFKAKTFYCLCCS